jgi:ferredoxin-type protein NapH
MRDQFNRRPVSRLRLIIQLLSFGVLIYGGFAVSGIESWLGSGPARIDGLSGPANVKQVVKRATTTDIFLPATSCIYQRQGLCKGCSLYYLTDIVTWHPKIEKVLGYLGVLLLLMLIGGRLWCGWVCPLGLLSDISTRLRVWTGMSRVAVSAGFREGLVWAKYIILLAVLGIAALASLPSMADYRLSLSEPFCRICPSRIFQAFFSFDSVCWTNPANKITTVFAVIGILAFALFFIGLTVRRFWCRLCPIGGLNAAFNRTGLVMIVKDGQKCTRCGACERSCPLDVQRVFEGRGRGPVTSFECHLCLRCVESCPEEGCLEFRWLGFTLAASGVSSKSPRIRAPEAESH